MHFARSVLHHGPLGLMYFAAASLALLLTRFDGGVAFLWIAAPILIAYLVTRSRRDWAAPLLCCGAASALATGLFGFGWAFAIQFAVINITEAYVGARLLRRARYARNQLGSVDWIVHFVVCVGIVAPAASALIAGYVLEMAGRPALNAMVHFYTGHALGNITFIPIVSMFVRREVKSALKLTSRANTLESIALLGLVAITTALVFGQRDYPLLFLPMLPVILATFRLGQGGAALSVAILAIVGAGMTMSGHGPLSLMGAPLGTTIQFFQFYLAATVLTVLPVAADLRNRARLHRELRVSEERYRLLADHSTDIMMHLESDGRIRFVSPSIRQLGGYAPEELVGSNANVMIAPDFRDRVRQAHAITLGARGGTHSYDYEAITRGGERRWFETHSRAVIDDDGEMDGVLCFIRDVSARKATERQLTEAAMTDALTRLPNRRAFRAAAMQLLACDGDGGHCLAVFDIDHFKRVNDRHGHDAGDAVLRRFAEVARSSLRHGDLVARIGGEEFAALMPNTTIEAALGICERMRTDIAAAVTRVGGIPVRVTMSGGVSQLDGKGVDAAYKNADAALYRAKKSGRDQLYLAA